MRATTHNGGMETQFLNEHGQPNGSQLTNLQYYFAWVTERQEIERIFEVVLRKQGWFCNRCGKRREMMYEGKLIRFEEDHACKPKDVLLTVFKKKERGW